MKVRECGTSEWDEGQHGLHLPHPISTTDFRVSGKGHQRIDRIYRTYCDRSACSFDALKTMPEDRMAAWLCQNCASFVLINTPRSAWTVISFLNDEDADSFRREFVALG